MASRWENTDMWTDLREDDRTTLLEATMLLARGLAKSEIADYLNTNATEVTHIIDCARRLARFQTWLDLDAVAANGNPQATLAEYEEEVAARLGEPWLLLKGLRELAPEGRIKSVKVLRSAVWTSDRDFDDAEVWRERIRHHGMSAGRHLATLLKDATVVGLSWGETITAAIKILANQPLWIKGRAGAKRICAATIGELSGRKAQAMGVKHISSSKLAERLASQASGCQTAPLWGAPVLISMHETIKRARAIRRYFEECNANYRRVFAGGARYVSRLDAILTSVGSLETPGKVYASELQDGGLGPDLLTKLTGDIGGVLIWNAQALTEKERTILKRFQQHHWLGIKQKHYERCARNAKPGVIVLALGKSKADITLECVRQGLINHLVIDLDLALGLWKRVEQECPSIKIPLEERKFAPDPVVTDWDEITDWNAMDRKSQVLALAIAKLCAEDQIQVGQVQTAVNRFIHRDGRWEERRGTRPPLAETTLSSVRQCAERLGLIRCSFEPHSDYERQVYLKIIETEILREVKERCERGRLMSVKIAGGKEPEVPTQDEQDWSGRIARFGEAAAEPAANLLARGRLIGVAWGETLAATVTGIARLLKENEVTWPNAQRIIATTGEATGQEDPPKHMSSSNSVEILADAAGRREVATLRGVPAQVSTADGDGTVVSDFFRKYDENHKAIFLDPGSYVTELDAILTSVGSLGKFWKIELEKAGVKPDFLAKLDGDIGGVLLVDDHKPELTDDDRRTLDELRRRWLGISKGDYERCAEKCVQAEEQAKKKKRRALRTPGVVVVALGEGKAPITLKCIELGLVNHLVIDFELALALWGNLKGDERTCEHGGGPCIPRVLEHLDGEEKLGWPCAKWIEVGRGSDPGARLRGYCDYGS